ncbi:acetylornithine carbamoyltransferase [Polluticoccus soli]|uniref:acetylornithine carbamoyltransferase n=1 Tax=Polluticoccus soli TaxID=3034150 RepID=UPI0023E175D5|nr:acetylornithine carbamoyltransferase [Flavipsychrobacter sp. JY13-12]
MQHFTSAHDVPSIDTLVKNALAYKSDPLMDSHIGTGKRIGLLFMNPSMRTRLSTQIAARNLGMDAIVFNIDKEGWALELEDGAVMNGTTVEHIKDAAPVLGSYFDVLCVRSFPTLQDKDADYSEAILSSLKKYTGIPVVSLESATLHPLQSLADVMTISETFTEKRKPKVVLTWAPHIKPLPQCVANSFAEWMNVWDAADFVITHPEGYELGTQYTNGATIEYDRNKALQNADYVYVKNWSSYNDYGKILSTNAGWMPTMTDIDKTNNASVMHCLPVRRNIELSDELLDSANSLVTRQAANRVWAAQAVLAELIKQK